MRSDLGSPQARIACQVGCRVSVVVKQIWAFIVALHYPLLVVEHILMPVSDSVTLSTFPVTIATDFDLAGIVQGLCSISISNV
jgi:hypothetical protein